MGLVLAGTARFKHWDSDGKELTVGSLIAILLGRLRMSVPDAIHQYSIFAKSVFSERKLIGKDGWFKASNLEEAIKHVLNWKLGPGHADEGMLESEEKDICRV